MKNTLFALLTLGLAGTASADAINSFTWDTFSSDDKMYVCNVGIMHADGTTGHVDDNAGGADSGETASTHDYMTVTYARLNKHQELGAESTKVLEANLNGYKKLFTNANAHKMVVTKLTVNLSSENYGAKYFVDVCYRGAQIDYSGNGIKTNYVLNQNQLTYSDHATGGHKYFKMAELEVKTKTVCDTQLMGDITGTDDGLNYDQTDSNIAGSGSDFTFRRSFRPVHQGTQGMRFVKANAPRQITPVQGMDAPRYCKTRYVIAETKVKSIGTSSFEHIECPNCNAGSGSCVDFNRRRGRICVQPVAGSCPAPYIACVEEVTSPSTPQPRNWTRSGGTFTSLTEIENRGSN